MDVNIFKILQIFRKSVTHPNRPRPMRCKYSYQADSTIYSLSSGQGKCGVAVIRISGPNTTSVLSRVGGLKEVPEPRKAILRRLKDPETNESLDQGLVLWFPGPHSFTGEDSCELQIHGGTAVISAVLGALSKLPGLRPALPGEFTKRAFFSNKLDLTEVEGLADLIHAETEMQHKQALNQMEGALNRRYSRWRKILKMSIAHVEAYIDFSEDHNIEEDILQTTNKQLRQLEQEIQEHLEDGRRGERTRDGVKTVIVGAPNVGKSSLLNALCERPAAIVSPQPGTTRDVISSTLDIAGYPVVLRDTAGLRGETTDLIEKEGILRAHQTVCDTDLILLLFDASHYEAWIEESSPEQTFKDFLLKNTKELELEESVMCCGNIRNLLGLEREMSDTNFLCLVVFNKLDLVKDTTVISKVCAEYPDCVTAISCKTNEEDIKPLLDNMTVCLKTLCGNPTRENACISQARHRFHLKACAIALARYQDMSGNDREIDQAAQRLREALNALGHITGHVSSEQILDVIFSEFCIGK